MEIRKALTGSIIRNVAFFWLLHSGIFVGLSIGYGFFPHLLGWYAFSSVMVCGLLLGVLLYARHHFFFLETQEPLDRVNLANQLTIFRITSLPAILMLFIASHDWPLAVPLVIYMAASFITDTLDGFISRTTHQVTRIGQYLDSMSDYAVLIGIAIAFVSFSFIPLWFFLVVLIRYLAQWVAMGILFLLQHGTVEPRATILGKVSVATSMGVFALGLLQMFPWYQQIAGIMFWVEMAVAAVLVVSLAEKLWYFVADYRAGRRKAD
jgi:phosphatidylglycerophosphate synthase